MIKNYRKLSSWIELYMSEAESKNYAENTMKAKRNHSKKILEAFGDRGIRSIKAYEVEEFLKLLVESGSPASCAEVFSIFNEVFRKAAMYESINKNIMVFVKKPYNPPKRSRLLLSEWLKIYEEAERSGPLHLKLSMLLALVAGMRVGDIIKARKGDVWDSHLHITLDKDKNIAIRENRECRKIAIPIDLRNDAIGMSIRDIIEMSPFDRYIIHHKRLNRATPSNRFKEARDKVYSRDRWISPPSFHEQRSLAERLYRDQGVNTKRLLGHATDYTTDKYDDAKGREYTKLIL